MNPRALRLVRATAVTATAVVLASAAHLAAGGAAPGIAGLTTAFVFGTILGTALLSGRRLTVLRTAATIAGGQAVFHAVFSWGAVSTSGADAHAHASSAAFDSGALDAVHAHDATSMLLAHVVAGLLSLAVLLVEVHLLDHLVMLARRAVFRLVDVASPVLVPSAPLRIAAERVAQRPRTHPVATPALRRGPPALTLAV